MIKVSVLVPVYNVEKYLRECLDSLISQTLREIEIICINDGSTDLSADIIEEYADKDSRIKLIDKKNSGYGASLNMGLTVANGEYIGIIESDDFAKENMFESLYSVASQTGADVVKADFYYYFSRKKQSSQAGKINRLLCNKVFTAAQHPQILKMMPTIWSAVYKRKFLIDNQINFLETPGASYQDTSFGFKTLALAERIFFTDKAYLYYRQDNENSSVKSKDKIFMICDEYNEITDFLNSHPALKLKFNTNKLIKQYNAYMWNLTRLDEVFREKFIDVFAETFSEYYNAGEITKEFFKKINKKEFELLLLDIDKFKKHINKIICKKRKRAERKKMFSIRINLSRISIVLFGKKIL